MTRFGKISPLQLIFRVFGAKLNRFIYHLAKNILFGTKFWYWAIFICCKWPNIAQNNLTIWSHWPPPLPAVPSEKLICVFLPRYFTESPHPIGCPNWSLLNFYFQEKLLVFKIWANPGLFFFYSRLYQYSCQEKGNVKFADNWIRTGDLWRRKRLPYPLSKDHI